MPIQPTAINTYIKRYGDIVDDYPVFSLIFKLTSASLTNPGAGYIHNPSSPDSFFPAFIRTPYGNVNIEIKTNPSGAIIELNLPNPIKFNRSFGKDFVIIQQSGANNISGQGGTFTASLFTLESVIVTYGGRGFSSPPNIRIRGSNNELYYGLTATINGGSVDTVTISPNPPVFVDYPRIELEHLTNTFTVPSDKYWEIVVSPKSIDVFFSNSGGLYTINAANLPGIYLYSGDRFNMKFDLNSNSSALYGLNADSLIKVQIIEYDDVFTTPINNQNLDFSNPDYSYYIPVLVL